MRYLLFGWAKVVIIRGTENVNCSLGMPALYHPSATLPLPYQPYTFALPTPYLGRFIFGFRYEIRR